MMLAQTAPQTIPDLAQFLTLPLTFGSGLVGLILLWKWVLDPYLAQRHTRRMQIIDGERAITKMQTEGIEGIKTLHQNVTTHLGVLERIVADAKCDECPTKRN